MSVLISFATPNFYTSLKRLVKSATKYGIDSTKTHTHKQFQKTEFYKKNKKITEQKRGAGYWIWKPYYILQELSQLTDNQLLVYCDSGVDIVADLKPLLLLTEKSNTGVILFENYQGSYYINKTQHIEFNYQNVYKEINTNKYWVKRDVFIALDVDEPQFWNAAHIDANFMIFKKCDFAIKFVEEWLDYCCQEQLLCDNPNTMGKDNFHDFIDHRHDQALMSVLAAKHKIVLYRCASQFGNHYKTLAYRQANDYLILPYADNPKENSQYGTLLNHHRQKTNSIYSRWKSFLALEIKILFSNLNPTQ